MPYQMMTPQAPFPGMIFQLIILGIFFWIVYLIVKDMGKKESALDILKRRYAGGDISKKEFEKLKKEIE